jgi:hypothetical protein
MRSLHALLIAVCMSLAGSALAFESDVHFGLTEWLALQAGYDSAQAETIALGDQRVDSGDVHFVQLAFAYACPGSSDASALLVEQHHFPSAINVPASIERRPVVAGSDAARKAVNEVVKIPPAKAGFMLLRLGESLHVLQDSWSNQGISDLPEPFGKSAPCDETRVWSAPRSRGGWSSHKADLTMFWPAETLAMAKATYEVLLRFPVEPDRPRRTARDWNQLAPLLDGFIGASTKTEKIKWFAAQGVRDVSFLEGISLKDGAQPFDQHWSGRRLPRLTSIQSRQQGVKPELLDFYSRFFSAWISAAEKFDGVADQFGVNAADFGKAAKVDGLQVMDRHELAARLALWRLRDHGAVAELVLSRASQSMRQLTAAAALAKAHGALAHYESTQDAFLPILPETQQASALAPYVVVQLPASPAGNSRALAAAKLRNAPYDTVGVVAEQIQGRWRVVSLLSIVEH